jgi:hypothetical protein
MKLISCSLLFKTIFFILIAIYIFMTLNNLPTNMIMKKAFIGLLVLMMLVVSTRQAVAQDEAQDYRFTLKTNPLAVINGPINILGIIPITGEYKILFEAKVSPKSSIQIGAGYLGPSALLNLDRLADEDSDISGIKTSGFRGQAGYRYFLSRDLSAPEGFYLGPHVSYAAAKIVNKDDATDEIAATKLNISILTGYQLITSGGFTLDVFMGMGLVAKNWDIPEDETSDWDLDAFTNRTTIAIPVGFSFGYAF